MKTLQTLIKLQKSLVDEQRQHLAKLQEIVDAIANAIAQVEIEKTREQLAAENNPEAQATYGAFLKQITAKARNLENERQAAAHAVELARAKLSELFEEQKRYEIADAARAEAEAKEEQRRIRIALDEVGSISYGRRKGSEDKF